MSTTTISCQWGQTTAFIDVPVSVASVATENTIIIQVRPGKPVDVQMTGTQAWTYRATTGVATNDQAVSAGQTLTLRFYTTTTFYILRQSVDGSVTFTPLAVSQTIP